MHIFKFFILFVFLTKIALADYIISINDAFDSSDGYWYEHDIYEGDNDFIITFSILNGTQSASWSRSVESGKYKVYAYIPTIPAGFDPSSTDNYQNTYIPAQNCEYELYDGFDYQGKKVISQANPDNNYIYLGEYTFADGDFTIKLSDKGSSEDESERRAIILSHIKLVPVVEAQPVNGSCGTADGHAFASDENSYGGFTQCSAGTSDNTDFPSEGGSESWKCVGSNGGTDDNCDASRNSATVVVNGSCGTADGHTFASDDSSYGSFTQCSAGTSDNTDFPSEGGSESWKCVGSNGGTDDNCDASRETAVSPLPTMTLSDVNPTSGSKGTSFEFKVTLSEALASEYKVFMNFNLEDNSGWIPQSSAGGHIEMSCSGTTCTASKVLNGVGERKVRVGIFENDVLQGSYSSPKSFSVTEPSISSVLVTPVSDKEGSNFTFTTKLSEPLVSNYLVKLQLETEDDNYLDAVVMDCDDVDCSYSRVINTAKYDRKVRFGVFENGTLTSAGWKVTTYNVEADPLVNKAPVHVKSYPIIPELNMIPLGEEFKFYTKWSDEEKNFIVGVKLRYRKVGSSTWSNEMALDYYQDTTFVNNQTPLKIDAEGDFEFEVQVSDQLELNRPNIHTTEWTHVGTFNVSKSIQPILAVSPPSMTIKYGHNASLQFKVIDPNNDIDRVEIDWSGRGTTVDKVTNLQNDVIKTASHKLYSSRTVTVRAYDLLGNRSKTVRVPITVIPQYIPRTYINNPRSIRGDANCAPRSANSVNLVSGAETFTLPLLSVKGLIPLSFNLSYNSLLLTESNIGRGWSTNSSFTAKIQVTVDDDLLVYWNDQNYNLFEKDDNNASKFSSKDKITKYDSLVKNSDKSYTLTRKNRVVYKFDEFGTLKSIESHKGEKLAFEFNGNGDLTKVIDVASSLFIAYDYNNSKLVKVSDSASREVLLSYSDDNQSNLMSITTAHGLVYLFEYNELGQMTKYSYDDGIVHFKNSYLENGLVKTEDDGLSTNQLIEYTFDDNSTEGKVLSTFSDRNGDVTKYEFDANNYNLLSTTDKLNNKTVNSFNSEGLLSSVTNAKNQKTSLEYDDNGNLIKKIAPDGSSETLTYDAFKNLISHSLVSADGNESFKTSYEYDAKHNLIKETAPNGESSTYSYNDENLLLTQTSPKGNTLTYAYDEYKRVKKITYANGKSVSYQYDNIGRVIKQIDQLGNEIKFTYDNADRLTKVENALGNSTTFTYDKRGNRVTATDPQGNVSTFTYDANNNLISQSNALGYTTLFEYDGEDRVVKVTDANGNAVSFEYDAMGRVVKTTNAIGNSSSVEYDALGNVKKSYDAMGNMVAEFFYDNTNKLIKAVDSLNQTTETSYNLLGQPSTITDAKSRVSKFNYDKAGRLVEAIDAMGGKSTQSYDKDGNRVDFSDPKANKTSYTYNTLGLTTSITTASGSSTSFEYDANNRLSASTNGRGQKSLITYYADGSIKSIKDEVGTIAYSYDKNGNLLTISENGKTITMTYSKLNQLLTYNDTEGNKIAYSYDKVGNLTKLIYPNGKVVNYSYNANSQLISVSDSNKTTAYEYDKNGRVVKITRPNGTVLTRVYNENNQLLSQKDVTASGEVISEFTFKYDKVGNIIEEKNSNEISPDTLANVEMSYVAGNLLEKANTQQAIFDKDDNMLELGDLNLSYDSRNRLTKANSTEYSYNMLNHKIAMSKEGTTTKYIVNPNAPLSQLLSMTNAQNKTTAYTYGLGLVSQTTEGETLYYHYDLRGSTIALTNENGEIVDKFSYLPYGELYKHSKGSTDTPFLYNGRDGVMEEENNLYYMRARYYSMDIKRFINRDVLIGGVGDFGSLNRFGYVSGNSISYIDPLGLLEKSSGSFSYDIYVRGSVKHKSGVKATVYGVNLKANNGNDIQATKLIEGEYFNDTRMKTDCHGVTFAEGKFWINDDQVPIILKADGYVQTKQPRVGDVLVYRDSKNPNYNTNVKHSVRVIGFSKLFNEPVVEGLGGVETKLHSDIAGAGWHANPTLTYYTQAGMCMNENNYNEYKNNYSRPDFLLTNYPMCKK